MQHLERYLSPYNRSHRVLVDITVRLWQRTQLMHVCQVEEYRLCPLDR